MKALVIQAGETVEIGYPYLVTKDDIRKADIRNRITVTGKSPSGAAVSATDEHTLRVTAARPLLTAKCLYQLHKAEGNLQAQAAEIGDTVEYAVTVTNAGNMGIFLIRQFILTIPKSYDEAAMMDGASRYYCFLRIIVPMAKPAIMVVAVQTFIGSWNDFYNPLIYINSESKMTLPLGLTALRGMLNASNESALIASVLLTLLAPLLLYVFGQRYLVEGITLGGLKG